MNRSGSSVPAGRLVRVWWLCLGLIAVALGGIGIVIPGLPTTVFFIAAAWCFARSSPRLERWVLDLPGIGQMVRDYRAGLGMPLRAKLAAIAMVVIFVALAVVVIDSLWVRIAVAVAGLVGVGVIALLVPTRERVLAERRGRPA